MDVLTDDEGKRAARCANTISAWLGARDFYPLDPDAMSNVLGTDCADLFVLFGGGVVEAADVLAEAMRQGMAHRYAIVGGKGRATWNLREFMQGYRALNPGRLEFMDVDLEDASEAELLNTYLQVEHDMEADWLETRSTNCGNNVTFLLDLLEEKDYHPQSIILSQDAAMEVRMLATLARQSQDRGTVHGARVARYAYYDARVVFREGELSFEEPAPKGMWPMDFYLGLLTSEVSRLRDDEEGYGPRGRDFIVHLDIPSEVEEAASELERIIGGPVAYGDSQYAIPLG